ncbi:MAG TPA: hypothetical protein VI913_03700 [Candidatus Peribacteraceae bacterium]|nr:hypothetical protein [Candidatus Peribacteraceae bacterium]
MNNEIPDAVSAAPEVHAVVFENETFRVLDVKVPRQAVTAMHSHPKNICYVLAGGTLRFTLPEGSIDDLQLKIGQVTSSNGGAHIVENIGSTEVHVIQVELKPAGSQ